MKYLDLSKVELAACIKHQKKYIDFLCRKIAEQERLINDLMVENESLHDENREYFDENIVRFYENLLLEKELF